MTMKFNTSDEAVIYMTECTLATVEMMAMKKSTPKGEFNRQVNIAQSGVDFIMSRAMKADNRVADVINRHKGKVSGWSSEIKYYCSPHITQE